MRFVGEPIWSGRTDEEAAEASRHEALINLAFKDAGVSILCPYDTCSLSASVVAGSAHTHPSMIECGTHRFSPVYSDPSSALDALGRQLPELPPPAESLPFDIGRLRQVRNTVRKHARLAGLSPERSHELVVAVNELATNTLTHTPGEGKLGVWNNPGSLLCEVTDRGHLTDPLAGRRTPAPGAESGWPWVKRKVTRWRSSAIGFTSTERRKRHERRLSRRRRSGPQVLRGTPVAPPAHR
ncbi:MAG: sensor histidine kinase, partial [Actinobacteria bacterium]|nr:sensor histidine kinase [Actinomycetota bacterium]